MAYEVILLQPVVEFISRLSAKMRAKTFRSIELLKQFGPELPMPHSRKLVGYDLFELRIRLASNICRLFYFHDKGRLYVVTSGYLKKADRTSRREIERALRLKDQYEGERK